MKKQSTALVLAATLAAMLTGTAFAHQGQQQQPAQTQTQQTTTTTTTTDNADADLTDTAAMGPNKQYGDPVCGMWANHTWQPNGHCPGYTVGPLRARVAGTITAVRGHLDTVQQATKSVVIDDQPALRRETSGHVAVGRRIIAYGYWRGGNFYATALE